MLFGGSLLSKNKKIRNQFCKMTVIRKVACLGIMASALGLSSCVVPGIQELADDIGVERGHRAEADAHPKNSVVYRLDDVYYLEIQLHFAPVESCMFEHCDFWGNSHAAFCVGYKSKEAIEAMPSERYLVKLSPCHVADLLQRKVSEPPADAPELIAAADFDYSRAERCPAKPVKLKKYNSNTKEYGKASDYCPYINPVRYTAWHTATRPLAWAAWGVEIPVFVATNAVYYATVVPFDILVESLLGG